MIRHDYEARRLLRELSGRSRYSEYQDRGASVRVPVAEGANRGSDQDLFREQRTPYARASSRG